MHPLNLPPADLKLKKDQGKVWIFDVIRKKFVVLTPEEWVRQHFVHYLIHTLGYSKSLFRIEAGLSYNKLQKRSDILIHDRQGKPWMLVECKSPDIKLTQKAFNQVAIYNMTVGAKFLAVTNGRVHFCCEVDSTSRQVTYLESFPSF